MLYLFKYIISIYTVWRRVTRLFFDPCKQGSRGKGDYFSIYCTRVKPDEKTGSPGECKYNILLVGFVLLTFGWTTRDIIACVVGLFFLSQRPFLDV